MEEKSLIWLKKMTDNTFTFRCLWQGCSALLPDESSLRSHLCMHSSTGVDCCLIDGCGMIVENSSHLRRHLNMHTYHATKQHSGYLTLLSRCGDSVKSCGFAINKKLVYNGDPLFCRWNDCNEYFDDINEYAEHINGHISALSAVDRIKEHDNSCKYLCLWQDCVYSFSTKHNLIGHVRHHSGDKVSACPFCGAFFSSKLKLVDHCNRKVSAAAMTDQSTMKKCFHCQKSFECDRLLREHARRHVKNCRCEICGCTVESPSDLRRHVQMVHEGIRHFVCDRCPQRFAQKNDLERHMVVHETELNFKCTLCEEKFRWKKQLNAHLRSHQSLTVHTHQCHLCSSKYQSGFSLTRHLTKQHSCQLTDGCTRFQYKKCADGLYRLQQARYVSRALAEQMEKVKE